MIVLILSQITIRLEVLNPKESYGAEPIMVAVIYKNVSDTVIRIPSPTKYPYMTEMVFGRQVYGAPLVFNLTDNQGRLLAPSYRFTEFYGRPPRIDSVVRNGFLLMPGESLVVPGDLQDLYSFKPEDSPYTLWGVEFKGEKSYTLPWRDVHLKANLEPSFTFRITERNELGLGWKTIMTIVWEKRTVKQQTDYTFKLCSTLLVENPPAAYYLLTHGYWYQLDTLRTLFPNHPYLSDEYWWWLPRIQKKEGEK